MLNIAILASGNGSNAEVIIKYFRDHNKIRVKLILSNKETAGVLKRSKALGVLSRVITKADLTSDNFILFLKENKIQLIVLAGFLLKIPSLLIDAFPNRIINIHPALLPKYGGKGMYGHHVHDAVLANGETESGITIHLVNEVYDNGKHLFQTSIKVKEGQSAGELAANIHRLEHLHFPKVVEKYAESLP